jgi:hypothetical protein
MMLLWSSGVLVTWTVAAVGVTRRGRRIVDAMIAGAILGVATILVFHAASILRVNVFLDVIQQRDDWRNLVARYHLSGFRDLRAYANYEYFTMTPMLMVVGALAGSVSGALAGTVNRVIGTSRARSG